LDTRARRNPFSGVVSVFGILDVSGIFKMKRMKNRTDARTLDIENQGDDRILSPPR